MQYGSSLLLLSVLYLVALASPGPNFFIISQLALDGRKRDARSIALGVAVGSTLWAAAAIAGLAALIAHYGWLAATVRWVGAAYLVWYGAKLLLAAARRPVPAYASPPDSGAAAHGYRTGLFTSLTNPKSAAFWTSVFATTLPADPPVWFCLAACALVALLSAAWHVGLAVIFSSRPLRTGYVRAARLINGVSGGFLVLLGLHRLATRST